MNINRTLFALMTLLLAAFMMTAKTVAPSHNQVLTKEQEHEGFWGTFG